MIGRRAPRGYSLIEMIAVMAGVSTVLALGTVAIGSLGRIERASRAARDAARTADDLAAAFRADVHAAQRRGEAADGTLVLESDGRTVTYGVDGPVVLATRRSGDETPHVERFTLPKHATVRLSWFEERGRTFARMELTTGDPKGSTLWVEAALGLNAGGEDRP